MCCPLRSVVLFGNENKDSFFGLFSHEISVNEDLAVLIKVSSPKLHSAPLRKVSGKQKSLHFISWGPETSVQNVI